LSDLPAAAAGSTSSVNPPHLNERIEMRSYKRARGPEPVFVWDQRYPGGALLHRVQRRRDLLRAIRNQESLRSHAEASGLSARVAACERAIAADRARIARLDAFGERC